MALSTAKLHRALLLRLVAPLSIVCACLPQDDLASYSRAWTSEPEALQPAPPTDADGGSLPAESDAGEPSSSPGETPSPPEADDAGAQPDAVAPLDTGPDAALDAADADLPAREAPLDGGASSDAGS